MNQIKKYKVAVIPLICLLILLGECAAYFSVSGRYQTMCKQVEDALINLKTYHKDPKSIPSEKQLKEILDYRDALQKLFNQTLYTYKSMVVHETPLKPLEFKEKLISLNENYGKYKIPIQSGLSFKEYVGAILPSPSALPQLTRQLSLVTQIVDLLIENRVEAISEIKRLEVDNIKSTLSDKVLFQVFHLGLSYKIDHKNLLSFLNTITLLPSLWKIEGLSIKSNYQKGDSSIEAQLLTVNLDLSLTEYTE
ncbi:MAG: Amuc_1100 family pilus-like protein [Candidatus Aureabacteria bacterium]|nr:Amuc_1100 family pilus-like protein [Candidatus Auribacterota bacterium]